MNKKIQRIISALGKESERQRTGKSRPLPGREMLAITPDTGMFLSILIRAIHARSVLEIGTSSGYSTLWFADALLSGKVTGTDASIVTIDSDPAKVQWATENFKKAGVDPIVTMVQGRATEVLSKIAQSGKKKFDFVFLDADKENMVRYFNLVIPCVRPGGIVAADNMLYPEHYRTWMKKYALHVRRNPNVRSVTVPIGMGEEITLKLK